MGTSLFYYCLCSLLLGCLELQHVEAGAGNVWTYRGEAGPDYWHLYYPHCGGIKQSPITIVTNDVIVDSRRLLPFEFTGYNSITNVKMTLENNGHTVQVDLEGGDIEVGGSDLLEGFAAQQFHFHWGSEDKRGSEHDINGQHFPMEMHMVHYNKKYHNMSYAMDKENGLLVLGFFFKVGRFNPAFQEIINHFGQISHKDSSVHMNSVPLQSLLPSNLEEYYRYSGSLTTPPCYETVTWTLFNEKIEIAEEQLVDFRTKVFENAVNSGRPNIDISNDYRPAQCLNKRRIYASHPNLKYDPENSGQSDPASTGVKVIASVTSLVSLMMLGEVIRF